jgi:enterochelin esterase-like enzyme
MGPRIVSPEVHRDSKVTFRVLAPEASEVTLRGGWMGFGGTGEKLSKGEDGVWSVTVGPLPPELHGYSFSVDGAKVLDPRNPELKRSDGGLDESLVFVPGEASQFMEPRAVPHGEVRRVWYESPTTGGTRRMHVYTPPGYESGRETYPVLYLFHGGGDNDEAWTSIGRANVILDNLIAEGKARPMVVVMPALLRLGGPARRTGAAGEQPKAAAPRPTGRGGPGYNPNDPFRDEMMKAIVPLVEKNYRVRTDRDGRAIAGLSMGGIATLSVGIPNLDKFGAFGVFSSGYFGSGMEELVDHNRAMLDNAELKKSIRLFYVGVGQTDIANQNSKHMVESLEKLGIKVDSRETPGGHTWENWRHYLNEFAPKLFQGEGQARASTTRNEPRSASDEAISLPPAPEGFDKHRDGIPHGRVETVEYDSKTVGARRRANVYTPPGYSDQRKYPVLYLLHGIGGDEREWLRGGAPEAILDNLLADGKAVPMIVVLPNGRAAKDDRPGGDFRRQFPAFTRFEDDLIQDLIPFIDSHYSAAAGREHRALAGLSMGGGQSLNIGLRHPEVFAWVGGFSSAPNTKPDADLFSGPPLSPASYRLLWVSCGDADRLLDISRRVHTGLQQRKLPHIWLVEKGGHDFRVWKNDLYLLAQRLFR